MVGRHVQSKGVFQASRCTLLKSCLSSDQVQGSLRFLSTSLGSAATASAEAGLQTVDEVADDGQDEKEDDDNDRDDDVAGHVGGGRGVCGWVGRWARKCGFEPECLLVLVVVDKWWIWRGSSPVRARKLWCCRAWRLIKRISRLGRKIQSGRW